MPHELEIFWDIIEMWSFHLRCWSHITPRNLALFTHCTTSFRKITSFWGVGFFLRDNMTICVLFTLRVSLLESNHNATLANSVLRISTSLSIESFWTYTVVSSAKSKKDRTLLEYFYQTPDCDWSLLSKHLTVIGYFYQTPDCDWSLLSNTWLWLVTHLISRVNFSKLTNGQQPNFQAGITLCASMSPGTKARVWHLESG